MMESVQAKVQLPVVQGFFGPRVATYTSQLTPSSIETILGHDPRSKFWKKLADDHAHIYRHLQRATTKPRLDQLIRYIQYRFIDDPVIIGAFPAISIAVQNPTEFRPFEEVDQSGVGVLHFDLSRRNRRIVVDGLGRVSGALELLEWSESAELPEDARLKLQSLLSGFTIPVVFYLPAPGQPPLTLDEMQQLFHDFNFRVTPVPPRIAIALDHSDVYIGLTNRLGKSEIIVRHGGMEERAASLGKKSTAIVVQQNLLRFVRGATEGERFLEAKNTSEIEEPNLTHETLHAFEESLESFLENVSRSMGEERFRDRACLHLTSPGWGALGIIYHDLAVTLRVPDIDRVARRIGEMDWHRSAPEWHEIVRERTDKNGNTVTDEKGDVVLGLAAGGAQSRRFITKVVREKLRIDKLLAEREETPEAA